MGREGSTQTANTAPAQVDTLNSSFNTLWRTSDEPFYLYWETLTNFSTDIYSDLFTIKVVVPTVSFEVSIEIEETIWDAGGDFHGLSEIDNSGLPMTAFAELTIYEGELDTAREYAEFIESWKMINNTMLERGIGELIARNQNITIRGRGARMPNKDDMTLLDR